MQHLPNPDARSPAAGNGRANRKSSKPGRLKKNEYADGVIVSRVSVLYRTNSIFKEDNRGAH
jgi:hypothetical protein